MLSLETSTRNPRTKRGANESGIAQSSQMDVVCLSSLIEEPLNEALNSGDVAGDFTTDKNNSSSDERQEGMLDRDCLGDVADVYKCCEGKTKLKTGKTIKHVGFFPFLSFDQSGPRPIYSASSRKRKTPLGSISCATQEGNNSL